MKTKTMHGNRQLAVSLERNIGACLACSEFVKGQPKPASLGQMARVPPILNAARVEVKYRSQLRSAILIQGLVRDQPRMTPPGRFRLIRSSSCILGFYQGHRHKMLADEPHL